MDQLTFDDASAPEVEEWRPVGGYEGIYEVSSLGRVNSLPRMRRDGRFMLKGRILKPYRWEHPDKPGHFLYYVGLTDTAGKQKNRTVHTIVAAAFIGPRPEGQDVRHGPNGSLDNRASQLCYGSKADNNGADKRRDGTLLYGEDHQNSKLTMEIVAEARRRAAAGESQKALGAEYGVSQATIGNAIMGRTWAACPVPTISGRRTGGRHQGAKLTREMVIEARRRHAAGESINSICKDFPVTWIPLRNAIVGKSWADVPMPDVA